MGFEESPQCSACFILSVEDTMESILDWNTREGRIFRGGSGSGINLSNIRGSMEPLAKGGTASGPVSFMRGADSWAGTIKSGGKTRRAAKMVVLDVDHPDIREFIWCKAKEEDKAAALRDAGFDMSIDGDGFHSIQYQNANNSVRVTDEFMHAVEDDADWHLIARTTGEPVGEPVTARELMREIAEAAWRCADPGVQYDTTINQWHTSPELGPHQRVQPVLGVHARRRLGVQPGVAEPDEVPPPGRHVRHRVLPARGGHRVPGAGDRRLAVELPDRGDRQERPRVPPARPRLRQPRRVPDGQRHGLRLRRGSRRRGGHHGADDRPRLRAVGQDRRRRWARTTATRENREAHNNVMRMHRDASYARARTAPCVDTPLLAAARETWNEAVALGELYGYRNAQATVLAPTGTISFLMDCDTTGIEPDFSLVKYKELVGGGNMIIANRTVPMALRTLGYGEAADRADRGLRRRARHDRRRARASRPSTSSVFDVAVGERAISPRGHIKMMGAVQPFLSGAISKTVNMPQTSTVEDIAEAYIHAWKLGVKALAIYRDGSKTAQALRTDAQDTKELPAKAEAALEAGEEIFTQSEVDELIDRGGREGRGQALAREDEPLRKRMPRERQSLTHKFSLGGHEGYITAGMYEDGTVGEIFLTDIGKEGSTLRGMMNSFATAISISLQYGVPLETLVRKFAYMRFEPEGITTNPEIPFAKSMPDYIMRWLASRFLDADTQEELGILTAEVRAKKIAEDTAVRRRHGGSRAPTATAPQRRRAQADPGARPRPSRPTVGDDGHPAGRPGPHDRPGPRPGLQPVRRHDAAHRLLLHVLELRQQHRLRLIS